MDEKVKGLLQELGDVINETVTASPRIASVMTAIKNSGYEVFLILEANPAADKRSARPGTGKKRTMDGFTDDDRQFLKRLRIKC
ncbi:MAG: hypothetical protein L0229_07265 [Blastocatellia bacterium]|nr:hypothetical protein [Blastocatellia bacterium]